MWSTISTVHLQLTKWLGVEESTDPIPLQIWQIFTVVQWQDLLNNSMGQQHWNWQQQAILQAFTKLVCVWVIYTFRYKLHATTCNHQITVYLLRSCHVIKIFHIHRHSLLKSNTIYTERKKFHKTTFYKRKISNTVELCYNGLFGNDQKHPFYPRSIVSKVYKQWIGTLRQIHVHK